MLILCERMGRFAHLKSEISDLKGLAESVSRQIRAWAGQLQDSPIKGQRHLTQDVRDRQAGQARRDEFDKFLTDTIRQSRQGALPAEEDAEEDESTTKAYAPRRKPITEEDAEADESTTG